MTDGVSAYGFSAPTFSALQEAEGHMATLFPAGLESSRPEIIVPVEQRQRERQLQPQNLWLSANRCACYGDHTPIK
ncbi:MAG: hypothetical protein M5U34_20210 [Chloroflexi bacterium]|nr:hypothetical protein [Chloroflexota bacterium]